MKLKSMMLLRKVKIFYMLLIVIQVVTAEELPSWATNQSRLVEGDAISHWGTAIDKSEEIAIFKAEFMSLKGIKVECGNKLSKGITVPKKIVLRKGDQFRAYARSFIPYVECDYNKNPISNNNKDLVNNYLEEGLKIYDKLVSNSIKSGEQADTSDSKLRADIINYINQKIAKQNSRLDVIEGEVQRIKNKAEPHQMTIQTTEIHLHGSEASYQECIEEYNGLMDEAYAESLKNKVPGNLVGENSRATYNKAQRKIASCQKYRK